MNTGEILIYQNTDGNIKIDVRLEDETVWLTQEQMVLFLEKPGIPSPNIFKTFLRKASWSKKWYVGISDTPLNMALYKGKRRK